MTDIAAQFVFFTCRPGAESALKFEVAQHEPEWRLAFSRPGFVTFKHAGPQPLDDEQLAARHWVFARTHGISLGRLTGSELGAMANEVWQLDGVAALVADGSLTDIHVWQCQPVLADEEMATSQTPLALEIEAAVRAAAPEACAKLLRELPKRRRATPRNERVLDVFVREPNEWWVGYHRAVTLPQRWPGGVIPVSLPEHAVSRAYAKMEEALAWGDLPLEAGDECVEVGCAPGGASQSLLDRGMFVTGIDPADVDESVLAHPRFRHLKKRSKEVRRSEFVGVRWLAADINLTPNYTLDTVEAIITHPDVTIRGLILTLKLADWKLAEQLGEFVARVHGWGFRDVRVRQLATGGQEVCLVALRRRELRRLNRKAKIVRSGRKLGKKDGASRAIKRQDSAHQALPGPHF